MKAAKFGRALGEINLASEKYPRFNASISKMLLTLTPLTNDDKPIAMDVNYT